MQSGWSWLAALAAAALGMTACGRDPGARGRVLLVGLDGATLRVIGPLLDRGRLPVLAEIARAGVAGPLRSEPPLLSPRIWNTIATAKAPAEHGIEGWVWQDEAGAPRLYASTDRKVHALWNIASDVGLRVGVVNWLCTHPAEEVNGILVSDHFLPMMREHALEFAQLVDPGVLPEAGGELPGRGTATVFPEQWSSKLAALAKEHEPLTSVPDPFANDAARVGTDVAAQLSVYYRSDELTAHVALAVDWELRPDLLMVYLPGIDKVSHVLWGGFEDAERYPEALRDPGGARRPGPGARGVLRVRGRPRGPPARGLRGLRPRARRLGPRLRGRQRSASSRAVIRARPLSTACSSPADRASCRAAARGWWVCWT